MNKLPLILTLRVPADVDRSEFEPSATWNDSTRYGVVLVTQFVRREGAYLVGATGTFRESLEDVVSDANRFGALIVDQARVSL